VIDWMIRLGALATAIAALELMVVHRAFSDTGVFRWSTLARDFPRAAAPLFSYRGTWLLLILQLGSALALPWLDNPAPAWLAFASSLAISIRFRGSYNGGSDSMLLVVLLAIALVRSNLVLAGLAYAAIQLVMSYAISGVAKLGDARWRDGTALRIVVRLPQYGVPASLAALLSRPSMRLASWGMLAFECGFPIALADRTACVILLGAGATFHFVNAVVFGLNRFLWAWIAAYPALLFWVERIHDGR
jgi:hypothetical protein